jgi:hypothetical protein
MASAVCRCGHTLHIPDRTTEHVVCPNCSARVRIRRPEKVDHPDDGFIRFYCPCGRRLKVLAAQRPTYGKCPECGQIVPVPAHTASAGLPPGHPESPTADLSPSDLAALERWTQDHVTRGTAGREREPGTIQFAKPAPPPAPPSDHLAHTPATPGRALSPTEFAPVPEPPPTSHLPVRIEAGLRLCPGCGRPVHLQAETCNACGAPVPRR